MGGTGDGGWISREICNVGFYVMGVAMAMVITDRIIRSTKYLVCDHTRDCQWWCVSSVNVLHYQG
jgi:hypothetical protein